MRIIFYPYIHTSARVILFPITLHFYFVDSQQLMHELITCHYDKTKNLNSTNKTKNFYDEELLHLKQLQSLRSAHIHKDR